MREEQMQGALDARAGSPERLAQPGRDSIAAAATGLREGVARRAAWRLAER